MRIAVMAESCNRAKSSNFKAVDSRVRYSIRTHPLGLEYACLETTSSGNETQNVVVEYHIMDNHFFFGVGNLVGVDDWE